MMIGLMLGAMVFLARIAKAEENYDIVVAAGSAEPVKFAASELSAYLGRITGRQPKILENGKGMFYVSLPAEECVPANIREQLKGHGQEAFVIESKEGRLYLVGNSPRAAVYAVYGFLEKHLGCRWYTPDPAEEIVPLKSTVEVEKSIKNGIKDFEEPSFNIRRIYYQTYDIPMRTPVENEVLKSWPQIIQWMAKLRINIFEYAFDHGSVRCWHYWEKFQNVIPELKRRGIEVGVHFQGIHNLLTAQERKDHPEWGSFLKDKGTRQCVETPWQLCTSNSNAVDCYISKIVSFMKTNSEVSYLVARPNDCGGWCECPKCIDVPVPDRYLQLQKSIVQRVREIAPGVQISHFAYGSYKGLPVHETLPGDVSVTYSVWGRDFSIPFEVKQLGGASFFQWRDLCKSNNVDMIVHEKMLRQAGLGLHLLPLPTFAQDLTFYKKNGVKGFDLPVEYPGWWAKSLNWVVLSRLMWNTDENVKLLVNDFFAQFYGICSKDVAEIYTLAESGMEYKYYSCPIHYTWWGSVSKLASDDHGKTGDKYKSVLPSVEHAKEGLEQALQKTRQLEKQYVDNPNLAQHLGYLEIVIGYTLQEYNSLYEVCLGVTAMEQARAPGADHAACLKQLDMASEHFRKALEFELERQKYDKPGNLKFIWDDHCEGNPGFSRNIPKLQELIAKLRQNGEGDERQTK